MKFEYKGENPDADNSLELIADLEEAGVIKDKEDILAIYPEYVEVQNITPSDELTEVLNGHPEFTISPAPGEFDPMHKDEGIEDIDKVGLKTDPINTNPDPESEIETEGKELFNNNHINKMKRKFNEEGVAPEALKPEVDAKAEIKEETYNPAGDGLGLPEPFTEEEIEEANNVTVETDGNNGVTVFTEEEIENETSPEEAEAKAEDMEQEQKEFSEHKKRLFSAKLRLRRLSRKGSSLKTFTEELTEEEKEDIKDDIVAILNESDEIREAVANEVSEIDAPEIDPVQTEAEEAEKPEETEVKPEAKEEETPKAEEEEMPEAFSDEEIAEAEEAEEADDEDKDKETEKCCEEPEGKTSFATRAGRVFCSSFSDDSVKNIRAKMIRKIARG